MWLVLDRRPSSGLGQQRGRGEERCRAGGGVEAAPVGRAEGEPRSTLAVPAHSLLVHCPGQKPQNSPLKRRPPPCKVIDLDERFTMETRRLFKSPGRSGPFSAYEPGPGPSEGSCILFRRCLIGDDLSGLPPRRCETSGLGLRRAGATICDIVPPACECRCVDRRADATRRARSSPYESWCRALGT